MTRETAPLKIFCRGCGAKLDVSLLEPFSTVPCPACGTRIRVPQPFDRYLLEKICGLGGMSKVYRAIDPEQNRRVAVKILDPAFYDECRGGEQFLREAKLVARLNHPGIVPIFDCGTAGGEPFLVMRYMARGSLEALLKARQLPALPILLGWLADIADGLNEARRFDIIHHDVKPGNMLIPDDGGAALGDFDLADTRDNDVSLLDSTGWASPAYVSPERLRDGREDWPGDVFSLGVSAYELITRQLPFATGGDTAELLERRRHPIHLPAVDLAPEAGPAVSELLDRMMRFDPERRPDYPEIVAVLRRPLPDAPTGLWPRLRGLFRRG